MVDIHAQSVREWELPHQWVHLVSNFGTKEHPHSMPMPLFSQKSPRLWRTLSTEFMSNKNTSEPYCDYICHTPEHALMTHSQNALRGMACYLD